MVKVLVVWILFSMAAAQAMINDDFDAFKKKFNKVYKNAEEEKIARTRLFAAKKDIDEHNRKFARGEVTYKRALWKKSDLSREERVKLLNGFIQPAIEYDQFVVRTRQVVANSVIYPTGPDSYNSATLGHVTPIKDQGDCGSCWAFSAIGALETVMAKKFGVLRNISEQNLIDCNRNSKTGSFGCVGGSQASSYMYIKYNNGIDSTEGYPYQAKDIYRCRYNASASVGTTTGYTRIPKGNETLLRDVVAIKGAVAFGMDGGLDSFATYSSGVYYEENCPEVLDHSATIYGYGYDNATGLDYWLVKNSWSDDWGDKGFIKIARGFNMCGLTNYLIVPNV